jgi:anti-sigma factor RsiW
VSEGRDDEAVLDEELSAFLDGELEPARAEALRARLARSPALAARLAALRRVDDGLRALPARDVPDDLLGRVKAQEPRGEPPALAVEAVEDAQAKLRVAEVRARLRRARRHAGRARRPRRRLALAVGAAAAAALLALALWTAPLPGRRGPERIPPSARAPRPATPDRVARAPQPPAAAPRRQEPGPAAPEVAGADPLAAAPELGLPEIADDELAVALELDALEDLELIERLDFLQFLARQGSG